jgi:hypothetical protein
MWRVKFTYIDYTPWRIFQIANDREVEKVVDTKTEFAEFVNYVSPRELLFIPLTAFDSWPTTEFR